MNLERPDDRIAVVRVVAGVWAFACGAFAQFVGDPHAGPTMSARLAMGLAMIGASVCVATCFVEGWQTGRMVIRGAEGHRGDPDFWTIGAIFILFSMLFGGIGIVVIAKELT